MNKVQQMETEKHRKDKCESVSFRTVFWLEL